MFEAYARGIGLPIPLVMNKRLLQNRLGYTGRNRMILQQPLLWK